MGMQDNLQTLCKQTGIAPKKHGYFQTKKPNGLICFSWHFELQGSQFSIINFSDGTVYMNHRMFEGSVIEALETLEQRINNFFTSRIRLN
jgi:nicotinamide mononucleotide (NMN) deamidase PncC